MNYERIALLSQVVSSFAFLVVMVWIWSKFIQPAVLSAQQAANARLAEAERHRDEAKAALASLQASVAEAERDAQAIRDRAGAHAQIEREAALKEARDSGERAVQNAGRELERAREAARTAFRDQLVESALNLARSKASSRVDDAVNAKFVSGFLNKLGTRGNG
jgi:F0F1-type ATP synthase membrane subunit b/b'